MVGAFSIYFINYAGQRTRLCRTPNASVTITCNGTVWGRERIREEVGKYSGKRSAIEMFQQLKMNLHENLLVLFNKSV